MSLLFDALRESTGERVVCKMAEPWATPDERLRLRREGEWGARLRDPNFVAVLDAGTVDDIPYIVFEHIAGGSLQRHMIGQAISPEIAAAWIGKVARAVGHLHRHGLVHRDLKPGNILLQHEPVPGVRRSLEDILRTAQLKVADLGLLHDPRESLRLTIPGWPVGTPAYMAPEGWLGHDATAAADVYSLGVILYELLTGQVPFHADSWWRLGDMVLHGARPKLTFPGLDNVMSTCLAREPGARFASGVELADALIR